MEEKIYDKLNKHSLHDTDEHLPYSPVTDSKTESTRFREVTVIYKI